MSSFLGSERRTWSATTLVRCSKNRGQVPRAVHCSLKPSHAGFSVFLNGDQNPGFQQNIPKRRLGVGVLCAASNALEDLLPLVPAGLTAIATVRPRQLIRVEAFVSRLSARPLVIDNMYVLTYAMKN